MNNKTIYVDIDFVLHNYLESFLNIIEKKFGHRTEIDSIEKMINNNISVECALEYHIDILEINNNYKNILREADKQPFLPTSFGKQLINLLKKEIKKKSNINIITARPDRDIAQNIINQAFGKNNIPIATASAENKHKFMLSSTENNKVYYIEDSYEAAHHFALLNDKNKVYMPAWPWNDKPVTAKNIERLSHQEIIKKIKKEELFND